jgi:hypothetical protein
LAEQVECGLIRAVADAVHWRLVDLVSCIRSEYDITVLPMTTNRTLKVMGYAKLLARPRHHAQNGSALDAFKNLLDTLVLVQARLPVGTTLEICWQDEARAGQKNKITQPLAPKDHRTKSAFIFGVICPTCGTGAVVVVLRCDTAAMQWHLNEIATQ